MKILMVGNGGREHALSYKITKSQHMNGGKLFYTGPNVGLAELAGPTGQPITEEIEVPTIDDMLKFAKKKKIDLTVVGPEAPLVAGIVDRFEAAGLRIFGPSQEAAELEGSKSFAKKRMAEFGVPTARYEEFTHFESAKAYIEGQGAPIVVKADGLAGGKGAIVCQTIDDAVAAAHSMLEGNKFKEAGKIVVVEKFLEGEEASIIVFSDGTTFQTVINTQDHKPVYDGDKGPNTGGMGAYGPAPVITDEVYQKIVSRILEPTIKGMAARGTPFKGFLYAGLMIDKKGDPYVVEFNVRCGDPETQPIALQTETDFVELMNACIDGKLSQYTIKTRPGAACCVVMADPLYPDSKKAGRKITGLETNFGSDVVVFHAGTKYDGNGAIVTNGGRVLGVTARGEDIYQATIKAYQAVGCIDFEGGNHHRLDIARKAIQR